MTTYRIPGTPNKFDLEEASKFLKQDDRRKADAEELYLDAMTIIMAEIRKIQNEEDEQEDNER
jgi:hypothetical protein